MKKPKNKQKTYVTDHMVFIGLGLAVFYWFCECFLNIFLKDKVNIIELLFGTTIDDIWARLIVLCLFVIFGSHAQFTIDNRKKAENALKKSEERYRTLVENIPIGMCRITPGHNGLFLMANSAFLKMFGFESYEELSQIHLKDIYWEPAVCHDFSNMLIQNKKLFWSEVQLRKKK